MGSYNEKLQNTTDIKNTTKGLVKFVEKTMYDPWSINNSSDTVKVFVETGTKNVRAGVRKGRQNERAWINHVFNGVWYRSESTG